MDEQLDSGRGEDRTESAFTDRLIPPWELPGNFRLDGEPDRGLLLLQIGWLSRAAGFCSLLALCGTLVLDMTRKCFLAFSVASLVLGVAGFILGVLARKLAARDLALMRQGWMDPRGRELTRRSEAVGT